MKKILFLSFPLALMLACSCTGDTLTLDQAGTVPTQGASDSGSYSGSDTSASTPSSSVTRAVELDDEADDISKVTFDRTIAIVFSEAKGATVTGDANGVVKVSGNQVTVDNSAQDEKVRYELSGTASDGFFKLYSANKQALVLNGLDLTNKSGAAINVQSSKRTFVVVNGTNKVADGASYDNTPDGEDEKAAFFGEGQLVFSGDGSLSVTATGKAGITSDDYVRLLAGQTVKVSSTAGHGVRGKDAVVITDGTLEITVSAAGKKGISSDGPVQIDGGKTTVKVSGGVDTSDSSDLSGSAGIKADGVFVMNDGTLTIANSGQGGKGISGDVQGYFNGGTVIITVTGSNYGSSSGNSGPGGMGGWGWGGSTSSSSDNSVAAKGIKFDGNLLFAGGEVSVTAKNHEAIESKGTLEVSGGILYTNSSDDAINAAGNLTIFDGYVCAWSTGNDALDANGNMYIKGGLVYAVSAGGAEVALDANTEGGKKLYISGGTLFALGGLENGAQLSQACYSASWSKNIWYSMTVGDKVYAFKTPSSGGNGLVVSGASKPEVKVGVSVSGGQAIFGGMANISPTVSGGQSLSLSSYTGSRMGW